MFTAEWGGNDLPLDWMLRSDSAAQDLVDQLPQIAEF